jgi:hypothetical protein
MASHSKMRLFLAQQGMKIDALVVDKLTKHRCNKKLGKHKQLFSASCRLLQYARSQSTHGGMIACLR